jgi:sodium-dependent phosphate cotransporter
MVEKLKNLFDRVIFRSPYRALFFGVVLTVLVQSSSITTSIAIPLVGAGILTIRQIMPYTMGANIGTTITSLLAALAGIAAARGGDGEIAKAMLGLHLAFFHVLFNVVGVIMVWPFRWIPILIAENFARLAMWNRMIPLVYIILTFYILPFLVVWLGR